MKYRWLSTIFPMFYLPTAIAGSMGMTDGQANPLYVGLAIAGNQTKFARDYISRNSLLDFTVQRPEDVTVTVPSIAGYFGYSFHSVGAPFRIQLRYEYNNQGSEYIYRSAFNPFNSLQFVDEDYKVKTQQLMVDLLYDFYCNEYIMTYIGLGMGGSLNKTSTTTYNSPAWGGVVVHENSSDRSFAYNAQLGLDVRVTDDFNMGVFARYTDLGQIEIQPGLGDKNAQQLSVGLKMDYYFTI